MKNPTVLLTEMNIKSLFEKFLSSESLFEYDCGQGSVMYAFECDSMPDREALIRFLSAAGAVYNSENEVDSLHLLTFLCDSGVVYACYSENEKLLRVVCDPNVNIPSQTPQPIRGECPVRLWQFEVDHSLIDCGMCYIVQLSDYRFFVIDSAHVYSVNDDVRIYEFMRRRTPSDRPVRVAGWFFSHGHSDHVVKFLDILRFNKDIVIEGLYYNIAPTDHYSACTWDESEIHHAEEFLELTYGRADIPVYTLHSGQRFFIGELEFCVLCTHEDVYPASLENYNDSSTVIMMYVGEDSVCFPGDAGGEESRILEKRFNAFLKCDIMQMAHHGHFGLSAEFYRRAAARVVLFPTTKIKYDEEFPRYDANRLAVAVAKHVFIASDGTVEFTFPLKGSTVRLYPDETFENFDGIRALWSYDYSDGFKRDLKRRFDERQSEQTLPF